MSECVLVLVAPPSLEAALVDWLLERVPAFSSFPIAGHGSAHAELSLSEQVEGRQAQVLFWVQLTHAEATRVTQEISARFNHVELHYWMLPVLASGRTGSAPSGG
ncbi:MAG: DUF3240 family protein [Gammaproteobacteria bacterium]